ncbi:MAG: glycerophosphoryl diester phosphodiesterase, partial [Solirubrobacteraceae bacterium]|nr:glycerophosphoryl diester phosphodiesterase [Solirubrobacteraceae bacterium]
MRNPVSIAHRGASGHAPEHTFAAYDLAMEMGCDYLEQDLQMTSDGVLVCLHDETLDRTVRGLSGRADEHTLAELAECDAGSWFDERFAAERVPTLDAVVRRYGQEANYYIETKDPETADHMEERLLQLLAEHSLVEGARARRQVLIQSFSQESLLKIAALD